MPKAAYVYPNIPRSLMGSGNPYIEHLKTALGSAGLLVDPLSYENAFADFVRNAWRAHLVVLNWMEDVPSKRSGLLQMAILVPYLAGLRLLGKRVVWIRHNRAPHQTERRGIKRAFSGYLGFVASRIVCHSRDALSGSKSVFRYHPSAATVVDEVSPGETDLLIWGSIAPYKGIREFLEYASGDARLSGLRIHVVGRCADPAYWEDLQRLKGPGMVLVNAFATPEELVRLFERSRCILFTYKRDSVSSSGVLIDSLAACRPIIGPDYGAFRDLARDTGFVYAYQNFNDIATLLNAAGPHYVLDRAKVQTFLAENSWHAFGVALAGPLGS
ncbi:MAG TPA: glycosyltransferase [Dinghuibacter sp.]|uniref:glycosyltransferase n=1 Tax=Dinghuibacter sp. TaxID=2024697 RepID=UPI002CA26769|nr:glycosyltransferase [Dinghuibacter sp.]HTJ11369.1 glycosyltransferase [Dinghuibacter sp.]